MYLAPMEGITDHIFRGVHHRHFSGVDKYYTPFFSPTADGRFPPRDKRDFDREVNEGLKVVPQLLTKRPEDFLWAARALAELGFEEINLNLGCPSGTVTAKGKGSGLLDHLEDLEGLLEGIFDDPPALISVKTRLGRREPGEFPGLMALYTRYPIHELTVHCRVGEDFYRKPARPEAFGLALAQRRFPVCYNGDLFTEADVKAFLARYPDTPALMIGRGAVADPAIFRRLKGGEGASREELRDYAEDLFESYSAGFGSPRAALGRMKEIWTYLACLFEGTEGHMKRLRKTTDPAEYRGIVHRIFGECPLREEGPRVLWQEGRIDLK